MGLHHGHTHGGHSHGPAPADTPGGDRRLAFAIAVNILLTVAQIIGGVFSGSLALVADAIHNLSDAAALAIALIARRIARHPADSNHTYGHGRAEMIGAVFNLSWLIFIGLFLVVEGIDRLFNPEPIEGWIVVIIAAVALLVDIATLMLTFRMAKTSMNIRATFIDNLSDAMASLGVIDPVDMAQMEEIKASLKSLLSDRFEIGHSTLEFEFPGRNDPSRDAPLGDAAPAH